MLDTVLMGGHRGTVARPTKRDRTQELGCKVGSEENPPKYQGRKKTVKHKTGHTVAWITPGNTCKLS